MLKIRYWPSIYLWRIWIYEDTLYCKNIQWDNGKHSGIFLHCTMCYNSYSSPEQNKNQESNQLLIK